MKPLRIIIYTLLVIIILYIIKELAYKGINNWSMSSSYGKEVISLTNGTKVYVIRESWGLNLNQIHLSQRNCGCEPAQQDADYIINFNSSELLYKVTDQGLNIYVRPEPLDIQEPLKPWANVIRTSKYNELAMNPSRYGISKTTVPHDQLCLINLFRKSSSLRSK